jgi:outer membrane protein assembly factor BamD
MEPEALVLLGETYLKMKEREKARSTFRLVLDKYPESPFTVPAKNFLARLGAGPSVPLPGLEPAAPAPSGPPLGGG